MRRETSNILIKFSLYLFLFFISSSLLAQHPSAVVVSGDTAICVSGEIDFKVKFTGIAPFGIVYEVLDVENNISVKYPRLHQSDAIQIENMDADSVWTETLTLSKTSKITVLKVYDATIPQRDMITPGDPAWVYPADGIDVIDQEMNIRVDHMPTPDAGTDINALCGYVATLDATPGDATHPYYWRVTPDGIFTDSSDPATSFKSNTHGTFTLWFVEESGVCIDSSSVDVELLGSPKATLSGSETICSTDGSSPQITLTVDYQSFFVPYSYTVSDGTTPYTRDGINITPDALSVPATGNQTFKIISLSDTRAGKQCFAEADDLIGSGVVTDLKPAAYAGEDKIICGELTTKLEGKLENAANSGVWSAVGSNISFGESTAPNSTATAITHGIYPMTWTETESVVGCTNSNDVQINFAEAPGLTYSKDTAICQGGTATLQLNATGNNPWLLTYTVDGSTTYYTLNTSSESIDFVPEVSTTMLLDSIVGNYGCVTHLKRGYKITVDEMPVANAGLYDPVCSEQIQLNAVPSIINSSGLWQGTGSFEDSNNPSTLFSSDGYGEQTLSWTETNSNNPKCKDITTTTIRFDKMPDVPYAGDDRKIYLEFSTTLEADIPDVGLGTWTADSPDITFNDINNPSSTVDNLKMGVQTFTWTVGNGVCENQSDDVVIEVKGLTNPTGFSPNGDGVNDFFKIMGGQHITGNELTVFNRSGKLVYTKKGYNNDWDGTGLDGSPLDDGTYYYIFTGDNIDPIKEYLIIKRSKTE